MTARPVSQHSLTRAVREGVVSEYSASCGLMPDDVDALLDRGFGDEQIIVQFLGAGGDASCRITVTDFAQWMTSGVTMIVEGKPMSSDQVKTLAAAPGRGIA